MTNRNYKRGADKERDIVKKARGDGFIAFRSAGSHSPIDVCVIDSDKKRIWLIQCKHSKALGGKIPIKLKEKLEKEFSYLNGTYSINFSAL